MWGSNFGLTTLAARPRHAFSPGQVAGLSAWYDPSDLGTLFQDVAMTVPVTAAGQGVAALRDKSGRGNHLVQSNAAKRPTYRTGSGLHWLQFDGVDDFLSVASFSWGAATAEMSLIAGVDVGSDAGGIKIVAELSALSSANNGTFLLADLGVGSRTVTMRSKGTSEALVTTDRGTSAPVKSVYALRGSIAADAANLRRNGAQIINSTADQGSGTYGGAYPLFVGSRGGTSYFFLGSLFGMAICRNMLSNDDVNLAEGWMAAKSGVIP